MKGFLTSHRKKIVLVFFLVFFCFLLLSARLAYLMLVQKDYYSEKAQQLHEREREIKAARGLILDRNGKVLATNKIVCTVSVIHSQIQEEKKVIELLASKLSLPEEEIRKKVKKVTSIEKIKSNVDRDIGTSIKKAGLAGIKVDEDYKRFYPYETLASKVLGFTGSDNQGIIGLEVKYEEVLRGQNGILYTLTDAKGREQEGEMVRRKEPITGNCLKTSLDYQIQSYATMLAEQVIKAKEAQGVSILCMNPQNGEIYACVNVPEFDLNHPYEFTEEFLKIHPANENEKLEDLRNSMWRNNCMNDTYEPGSTFKVITAAAALEAKVVKTTDMFHCPGFCVVEDRRIRCHKTTGHGSENFVEATMNSCNPVFVAVGQRIGADRFYDYIEHFGLLQKTGIDVPGEANSIMHQKDKIGLVELATMSFGQSFQITPVQLLTTFSMIINGGNRIVPHFATKVCDEQGNTLQTLKYETQKGIVSKETSDTMREILECVVKEGGGKNGQVEGYAIGGKTATSQTLPRASGRYISSFVGFAPVENPQIITLVVIQIPKGVYYGGTIAAPVVRTLYENILPYLGIEKSKGE